jgi:peptide/nickel transport system ATP-binding protein
MPDDSAIALRERETIADAPNAAAPAEPLVVARDLAIRFETRDSTTRAVNGVSFELTRGEVLCVIGESGSGKSVMMRSLMRLLPPDRAKIEGEIRVAGRDVLSLTRKQLSDLRGSHISMIFQEPMTALDPVYTIGDQIVETVMRHEGVSRKQAMQGALDLMKLVKVPSPERRLKAYPHELSGGLRQRAMIAVALSCKPSVLLADEPTTALDATVQIQVLILLRTLQRELGMGVIFVTHDLGVAAQIADRVAVMYAGRIVEIGPARDVLLNPKHPYTMGMLSSTVRGQTRGRDIEAISGSPPDLKNLPPGCAFAPRCKYVDARCLDKIPLLAGEPRRQVACLRADEISALAFSSSG